MTRSRNARGKVFLAGGTNSADYRYRGVIWPAEPGLQLWRDEKTHPDPEIAFSRMIEAAEKLNVPVDVYRFGAKEPVNTTVPKRAPFFTKEVA